MTKKILSLSEFNLLPEELKLKVLQQEGVHIGKRVINRQDVILFQLYSFYVEVYYNEYRKDISHLIVSESADAITPYLDQIEVRDLDKNRNR